MTRPILAAAAAALVASATILAPGEAASRTGYRGYYGDGIIGGMSANEIVGGAYGYGPVIVGHPAYPGPVSYAAPNYPPPGCIIRPHRVWNGYRWATHKIRVCY